MSKPEVQATITLILRRRQIMRLLLRRHRTPDTLPLLVPPHVVRLRPGVQNQEVDAADNYERPVPAAVAGRVVLAVDVGRDDGAQLHEHVVERSVHRPARHSS